MVGRVEDRHKQKYIENIFYAHAYGYATVMSIGDVVGIGISLSEKKRLSANRRAFCAYANMSPMGINGDIIKHNNDINMKLSLKCI